MPIKFANGIQLAMVTAIVSGVSIFINKYAVGAIQPALVFTAVKNSTTTLMIIALLIVTKKWQKIIKLNKRELVYLSLIGLVGGTLPFYLYFTGLSQTSAINAALIHKTLVIWVAILAIPLLKEKLSRRQVLAVSLLFTSNVLVGGFNGFRFSIGELMILIATIFWAVENILAKKVLPTVDPDLLVAARMGIGSLVLMTISAIAYPESLNKFSSLNLTQIFWFSATAATLFLYNITWYRALKLAPVTAVSSILVASTLVTNVLSAMFVTHNWTALINFQTGLMFVGLVLFLSSVLKNYFPKDFNTSLVQ